MGMVSANEIYNMRYMEFIKTNPFLDYDNKYFLARRLLKKKPDILGQMEKVKKELENKYGYPIPALQTLLNSSNDLNSFYPLPNKEETITVRFLDLKMALDGFKSYLLELVDENCVESWGI
jgi:hypothetical protein